MKILYVTGPGEYAAYTFDNNYSAKRIAKKMKVGDVTTIVNEDSFDGPIEIDVHLMEFGEVDKNFLDFVIARVKPQRDLTKSTFYVIEEEGETAEEPATTSGWSNATNSLMRTRRMSDFTVRT